MIKLERPQKPNSLEKDAENWTTAYLEAIAKLTASPNNELLKVEKKSIEKKYAQEDVKKALGEMHHNKCAYCESQIVHITYPHIEHFKPKGKYPKLCFEWENLLTACSICNGAKYKGSKFPLDTQGDAIYINPAKEAPNTLLEFEYSQRDNAATINAKLDNRSATVISDFGLNRPELLKHRSSYVKKVVIYILVLKKGIRRWSDLKLTEDAALCAYFKMDITTDGMNPIDVVKEAVKPSSEYAAFARAFVKDLDLNLNSPYPK